MSDIENKLNTLSVLGEEIASIAYDMGGSNWVDVAPKVSGYNALGSEHRAVNLYGIEIDYFVPVQFTILSSHLGKLDQIIEDTTNVISQSKMQLSAKSTEEKEANKTARIAALKKELATLEEKA